MFRNAEDENIGFKFIKCITLEELTEVEYDETNKVYTTNFFTDNYGDCFDKDVFFISKKYVNKSRSYFG